jgi:outer membrane autotransporter protein
MHDRRDCSRHLNRDAKNARSAMAAAAALAASAAVVLSLASPAAAGSPVPPPVTFCDQVGCIPQGGPTSSSAEQISGSAQQQIEQRLQRLRCEGSDDPACAEVGGAAADAVSYEGLGIFFSAGYQRKDKTPTAFELGFESDSIGPTIGADYRIGNDIVVGGAFDYRHAFGEYDDNFGDFDTDTYTLLLFGSYYPTDQSFIDAALGFGYKQFDTEHLNNGGGGNVRGNTTGFDFTADLTGGYDFSFGALTVGPRLGVHYKRAELNGFTETGTAPLTTYSDQVDDSLTGTVGAQASYAFSTSFGVVVPTVNADYVREFLDDRENYTASVGAGAPFSFSGDQPDRNHFNVGGGVVVLLPNGVFPFINYEAEIANYLQETHTVTGGVRLEF